MKAKKIINFDDPPTFKALGSLKIFFVCVYACVCGVCVVCVCHILVHSTTITKHLREKFIVQSFRVQSSEITVLGDWCCVRAGFSQLKLHVCLYLALRQVGFIVRIWTWILTLHNQLNPPKAPPDNAISLRIEFWHTLEFGGKRHSDYGEQTLPIRYYALAERGDQKGPHKDRVKMCTDMYPLICPVEY